MRLIWMCFAAVLPLAGQTPGFEQRAAAVIDAYAHPKNAGPLGYANIAAKLALHEDAALCSRRLEELLGAGPTGICSGCFPSRPLLTPTGGS